MNRIYKFRAWDKESKEMFDPYFKIEKIGRQYILNDLFIDLSKNFILMEYIGFKDKDGKEIYEGDIIKTTQPIYTWKLPSSGIFAVEWIGAGFYPLSQDLANLECCEVIGNIWENPALIK